MKILVVDDDAVQRSVMSATLMASGADVIEADSGEAAIAAVQAADALDMILMDMRMPGMGGEQASDRIKALPGWRGKIQIKAISSAPLSVSAQANFDGFIPKGPDFAEALTAAVSDAMVKAIPPAQPPRKTLVTWLRINLALTMAILTLVSGGVGALVSGTVRVTRFDTRLEALEETAKHEADFQGHQEQDRVERDRRRVQLATDLGAINGRLLVLEKQSAWLSDYLSHQINGRH